MPTHPPPRAGSGCPLYSLPTHQNAARRIICLRFAQFCFHIKTPSTRTLVLATIPNPSSGTGLRNRLSQTVAQIALTHIGEKSHHANHVQNPGCPEGRMIADMLGKHAAD